MFSSDLLSNLHPLAILVAVALNMVIGMIWYAPPVFGTRWMRLVGLEEESAKNASMGRAFALEISGRLLWTIVIAMLVALLGTSSLKDILALTLALFLGFIVPSELSRVAWANQPWELFFITAGSTLVSLVATVSVLTLWPW